jgi:hypothetical protein
MGKDPDQSSRVFLFREDQEGEECSVNPTHVRSEDQFGNSPVQSAAI